MSYISPSLSTSAGGQGYSRFINVRMEDFVHKPDTGRLVWELFRELDVDLPHTIGERCCVKAKFRSAPYLYRGDTR